MVYPPTLLQRLERWSIETPKKAAMSFLDESCDVVQGSSIEYLEISLRSSNLAAHLLSRKINLKAGDRFVSLDAKDQS